jgi:hypothetical protein
VLFRAVLDSAYSWRTVTWRRAWPASLGVLLIVGACGGQALGSPTASAPGSTVPGATTEPTFGEPSLLPSPTPVTPAATPILHEGFRYGDILKIGVNRLAARVAPTRTAALVHGYDISGPAPIDYGTVRLGKGDYVSVQLGPLPIGDTVWYLVWPASATALHPGGKQWYTSPPPDGSPVPAWVAASVGKDGYMSLQRRPEPSEIEAFQSIGLNVAGEGGYVSEPQPRHDLFLVDWAAAAPTPDASCAFTLSLVPADADFVPDVPVKVTTTAVKTSSLNGLGLNEPWLPMPDGAWDTFTVEVAGTCNWALRFVRMEHD